MKKIGEILIEKKLVTEDILNEALEYQRRFGGSITQYLIAYGYISEEELAKCLSEQFGFPYLPLRVYNIPKEIIDLVPVEIAERYWLIPVDRLKDILTIVMADPVDTEAIKDVEKVSRCKVQPFVGILSDIIRAIEHYYHIEIQDERFKTYKQAPLFIDTKSYKGLERRKSVRLKTSVSIHFPYQELYKKSKTKDISLHGLLFESENMLPLDSYVVIEVDLPEEFYSTPIAAVARVIRVAQLENKKFDIGARLIKMPKEDLKALLNYARTHEE